MMKAGPRIPFPPPFCWLFAFASCLPLAASAQAGAPAAVAAADEYAPRTGDAWVDRMLPDIGDYAARHPDAFVDELVRYLAVSRAYAQSLLAQPGWRAGEVYFACALAKATATSCREVVRARARGAQGDWREVALGFDARPGDRSYQRIRETLRASYVHWARPLPQ